jgi:hypothetical protein
LLVVAVDEFLGGFPVVVPDAFFFEGIDVGGGGAVCALGEVFDGIGEGAAIGVADIADYAVDVKNYGGKMIHGGKRTPQLLSFFSMM